MSLKLHDFADLYTDFLISNTSLASGTSMASILGIKHDVITQSMAKYDYDSKFLWHYVKPFIQESTQSSDLVVLSFDDTIQEKRYSDESSLINWHSDHKVNRSVKGVNLLTAFFDNGKKRLPCSVEFVIKEKEILNSKKDKQKRKAIKTKNEYFREMLSSCVDRFRIDYVMADSWYSSKENMQLIKQKLGCDFIIALKSNRLGCIEIDGIKQDSVRIDSLQLGQQAVRIWLEGLNFPVMLTKQVFKNGDGTQGELYLACSDMKLQYQEINTYYKKRWGVEEYHKSIKHNTSLGKSPTKTVKTQMNHFILSIVANAKLEWLMQRKSKNHFALKARIVLAAQKAAYNELVEMKKAA